MDDQANQVEGQSGEAKRGQASGAVALGRGGAAAIARGRPGNRVSRTGRHGSDADRLTRCLPGGR